MLTRFNLPYDFSFTTQRWHRFHSGAFAIKIIDVKFQGFTISTEKR